MAEADTDAREPGTAKVIDPAIVAMEDALDRGDHVASVRLARELVGAQNPEVQAAGRAMLERLRPDPVIVGVLVSTGFLIVALALGYLGRR